MTILGAFFLPLIIVCFFWRPFYLLPLLVVASVFEAGSVFNGAVGDFDFGVSPFYLTEICIFVRLVFLSFGPTKALPDRNNPVRTIAILLFGFWLWSFISAFVMPRLFAGTLVSVPRNGGDEDFAPLQWSLSNLAQAGYLTLNVGMVLYALRVARTRLQARKLMKALHWAIFVVVFVGFAQLFAAEVGWDFPYETLNNNPGYWQGYEEDVGTIHRYNSTFTEPSNAGSYLSAIACGLLATLLVGERNIGRLIATAGVVTMLFLTTSTTGFGALAGGILLLMVSFNPFRRRKREARSSATGWVVFVGVFGLVALILVLNPDFLDAIIVGTISKWETTSFWVRLANDYQAMVIFIETNGIGVGLGSNRSSGLIFTMLSSVGLVGTALFAIMFYKIIKSFPGRSASNSLQMVFWALITLTISEVLSVPDVNRPVLWALVMLVLVHLNVHFEPEVTKSVLKKNRVPLHPSLQGAPTAVPAS